MPPPLIDLDRFATTRETSRFFAEAGPSNRCLLRSEQSILRFSAFLNIHLSTPRRLPYYRRRQILRGEKDSWSLSRRLASHQTPAALIPLLPRNRTHLVSTIQGLTASYFQERARILPDIADFRPVFGSGCVPSAVPRLTDEC